MLKMNTGKLVRTSLLIFTSATLAFSRDMYGKRGGFIELQPEQEASGSKVTSVIWKHNKDKAAEWFEGDEEPTIFSIFKGAATLNKQTWALNISNLQPQFKGSYSVEMNSKNPTTSVKLTVLDAVSKPNITKNCNSTSCTLSCKTVQDEYAQYTWTDSRNETREGPEWTVEKRTGEVVYTCNFSNPVSWEVRSVSVQGLPVAIIISVVVGGVVFILIVIGIYRWQKRKNGNWSPEAGRLSADLIQGTSCKRKERDILLKNKNDSQMQISQPEESSGDMNGTANVVANDTTIHTDEPSGDMNGTANVVANDTTIQTDEPSGDMNGTADVIANDTTIQTDGASDVISTENAEALPAELIHPTETSSSVNGSDVTADNGVGPQEPSCQPDTKLKMSKPELSEEEVETGETPFASEDVAPENNSSLLYHEV